MERIVITLLGKGIKILKELPIEAVTDNGQQVTVTHEKPNKFKLTVGENTPKSTDLISGFGLKIDGVAAIATDNS